MSDRHAESREIAGFTLLEMLVVMSIIGLAAYVSFVSLRLLSDRVDLKEINAGIARMAQLARLAAINENSQAELLFDLDGGTVTLSKGARPFYLPKSIQAEVLTGAELVRAEHMASIIFLPDGSSSGGEVRLSNAVGNSSTLRINWLTGVASIRPVEQ